MQDGILHAFLSGVVAAKNIAPGEPCNGPALWRAYADEMGIEGSLLKKVDPVVSDYDRARKYATHLAQHLRFTYYPSASGWEPMEDLTGILTQIDNMVAGIEKVVRSAERERCHAIALDHCPDRPLQSRSTAMAIANAIMEDPS